MRRAVKRGGVVAKGVAKAAVFGPPMKVKAAAGGAVGGVRDLREKREQRMLRGPVHRPETPEPRPS